MDKKQRIELLKRSVNEWNKWRERNPDVEIDLSDTNLEGANLTGANLAGAKLANSYLRDVNLTSANLTVANLTLSYLVDADLTGADLTNTDLTGAVLTNTDLTRAKLKSANLTKSNLRRANLTNANLSNSNFTEARFRRTVLDTDISTCTGLDSARHHGESTLNIAKMIKSKQTPPINFLRGSGLPEKLIEYLPALMNNPIEFYSCFISYSHVDKSFARRLHAQLQDKGIRCWLDEHQILPGDDIYAEVDKGLKLRDKLLLCASETSLNSWWVERELDLAFEREMELRKNRNETALSIIPLNLNGHLFKWDHPHAASLKKRLASDFVGWETNNDKFEKSFENLVRTLKVSDEGRELVPPSKL